MEQYWNKKRIALLLYGDTDSLELFLSQYEPVLFTWMYYQVGADSGIAADLTARTLVLVLQQLKSFNPAGPSTMFQWLKELAKVSRDEGLTHWQLKPQRPWAWSQLPDPLLKTLSELRSEPLRDTAAANPFVQEIVQASLTELEQADRELMMHRYSHLDTPESIAQEMGLPIEKVNDQLYKCRHSFRRVFFQLISSVNPQFSESNTGTGIEVLDNNLEKLLRVTAMYQTPSEAQEQLIRERFFQTANQIAVASPGPKQYAYLKFTIPAAVVLLILAVLYWAWSDANRPDEAASAVSESKGRQQAAVTKEDTAKPKTTQTDVDQEELKMIFQLGQEGKLEALLEILRSGQFTSQLAAAHFIGKLGSPSSVEALRQAEHQWYPNGPQDNPFAAAIAEIAQRYPGQVQKTQEAVPSQPAVKPAEAAPNKDVGVIKGSVEDFSGKPIAGARLQVLTNPLLASQKSKMVGQATTNNEGRYEIKQADEGTYFVQCTFAAEETSLVRQAVWSSKDLVSTCGFGNKVVLAGRISVNGRPLDGLKLVLSDSFDPEKAALRSETTVDAGGNYSFTGIRPGLYNLFSMNDTNKLVRIATIQVPDTDIASVDVSLQSTSLTVNYPEPNDCSGAALCYQFQSSPAFDEKQVKMTNAKTLVFDNVFAGSYVLKLKMKNGYTLQQMIEVGVGTTEEMVSIEPSAGSLVSIRGKLTGSVPSGIFLTSSDQRIHADLTPDAGGNYELAGIPAGTYVLACDLNGQLIELATLDLQGGPQIAMDFDVQQIITALTPLYVIVTDQDGLIVSNARVWLTGDLSESRTTGKGAFLLTSPGQHTLNVVLDGVSSKSVEIDVKKALFSAEPSPENTFVIRLANE